MNGHERNSGDADNFDVRGAVRLVTDAAVQHRRLVAIVALLSLAAAIFYVVAYPPVYRAEAKVFVERDDDAMRDAFYANWNVFRKDDARTEIELMTSGSVLKEVIRREKLGYADVYHPFTSHTRYLWESSIPGRMYKGTRDFFFPPEGDAPSAAEKELGKTLDDMAKGIAIHPVGDANVGELVVKGPSRKVARIANTLLDVYSQQRAERYYSEAKRAYDVLAEEVDRAGGVLREIGQRRLAFTEQHALAFDFQREMQEVEKLTELEAEIASQRARAATLAASVTELDNLITSEPDTRRVATVTELNHISEAAKSRQLELELALIQNQGRYRDDSPEIRDLRRELAEVEKIIEGSSPTIVKASTDGINDVRLQLTKTRNSLASELQGVRAGLGVMERRASELRRRMQSVPATQQQLRDLDREYALAQEVYQALLLKRAQSRVSLGTARATMPSLRVADYAAVPASKSWPRTKFLLPLALLFGACVGVVAAVILTLLEGRVRQADVDSGEVDVYSTISVSEERPQLVLVAGGQLQQGER